MSTSHKKHGIVILCVVLGVLVLAVVRFFVGPFPGLPTDKTHVVYRIGTSQRFTHSQIRDAVDQTVDGYDATGCAIDSVSFDEGKSIRDISSYTDPNNGESLVGFAAKRYGERNLIFVDLQYSCGKYVAQQMSPYASDTTYYCYAWHDGKWIYIVGGGNV